MLFPPRKHAPSVCPKTGKSIKQKGKFRQLKWLFPITGLVATVWFLVRVIPKPSRATYPCQRVAFPLASAFVIWLFGLAGSVAAYRKAKRSLARARYVAAAIFIAAGVAFIWMAMSANTGNMAVVQADPLPANQPIGVARGIHPGRVAWIHDPNATSWSGSDGNTNPPYWHSDTCTNQQVVNEMLSKALRALAGEGADYAAWDAIFRYFNQQMGKSDVGYSQGEKIAIKINFVLMGGVNGGVKPSYYLDQIDNSPQLAIALLRQLIDVAQVSPGDISIGDPSQCMPDYWYNMVQPNCPGVVYLTKKSSVSLSGRTQIAPDNSAPFYWSDPVASRWQGKNQDYIPTHFAQADYFINFAILKSHTQSGITVCGKNHYGSLRAPTQYGYYDMHASRPLETPGMGYYRANVDLMGHPKLGGKTLLALIDGLYSGRGWDSHPIRWTMAPFNNDWPSSIFLSQDPVAIDSVAYDFMYNEWTGSPTDINGYPQMSGAEDYLHEAALIPAPPSGTNYDPNHNGGLTQSLGVHEHWNNVTAKQYSRNLDPANGTGIELVNEPALIADLDGDNDVDLEDFAIFSASWLSQPGDDHWNPDCDISIPSDGVVDELDLAVFCDNWLR